MELKLNIESWEAYNSGYLLGKWHNVTDLSEEEFENLLEEVVKTQKKQLNKLLKWKDSLCEELFAPDFECSLPIEYNESGLLEMFQEFQELKELLEDFDEEEIEAINAIRDHYGKHYCTVSDAVDYFNEAYQIDNKLSAEYELSHFLMESTGELDQVPDHISRYFDHEAYGRDLILGGDFTIIETENNRYALPSR